MRVAIAYTVPSAGMKIVQFSSDHQMFSSVHHSAVMVVITPSCSSAVVTVPNHSLGYVAGDGRRSSNEYSRKAKGVGAVLGASEHGSEVH